MQAIGIMHAGDDGRSGETSCDNEAHTARRSSPSSSGVLGDSSSADPIRGSSSDNDLVALTSDTRCTAAKRLRASTERPSGA